MKLGLFGGTFNPVHYGHLNAAMMAYERFSLDCIYFVPSRWPPHKDNEDLVSADNRCEMITRSLPNSFPFSLSHVEVKRGGLSYAVDTVLYFKAKLMSQDRLFFIIGDDAFLEIHTWKRYKFLVSQIEFIIISRINGKLNGRIDTIDLLGKYIKRIFFFDYNFCIHNSSWRHAKMKPIHYLRASPLDISSTSIRYKIKLGKSIDSMVPLNVNNYIRRKGLYL